MGAKLDLLIKECEDYLNKNISRFEPSYKKFVEDYNKAITNTQVFDADSENNKVASEIKVTETTLKQLRKEGWYTAPGDPILAYYEHENSGVFNSKGGKTKLYDSGISYYGRSFTGQTSEYNAELGLQKRLLKANINFSNAAENRGVIFYKDKGKGHEQEFSKEKNGFVSIIADHTEAKWVFIKDPNPDSVKDTKTDKVEVVSKKVWPRDFFPDKPEIKTYGDFYKWLFNPEYGTVYYNEKEVMSVTDEYKDRYDEYTGKYEINRKFAPLRGSGGNYNLPYKLYKKLHNGIGDDDLLDTIQSPIFDSLYKSYDDVKIYKQFVYCRDVIKAENYSKKAIEAILREIQSNYILTKWTPKTPDEVWHSGYPTKLSYGNNYDIGLSDFIAREYPYLQDYYGGTSFLYLYSGNPWEKKTTLYDALIEAINENKIASVENPAGQTFSALPEVPQQANTDKATPENIIGKIILKVKSGPGVMIGQTEVDIQKETSKNNVLSVHSLFKGIQFDTPGDYIIAVTSTSPDVEPTEFKVKVIPEMEVIPQEESVDKNDKQIEGTRPIIAQIDAPTIKLPPMEFTKNVNDRDANNIADSIGAMPFVSFMGAPIQDRDIYALKIYHSGIIPMCSMTFMDSQNFIKNMAAVQDNSSFEVFINAKSPSLKSIHLKFKTSSFKDMTGGLYGVTGTLDVSGLYRIKYGTMNGTSFQVLRDICKEIGLGFNSNIINTNDSMTWRFDGSKIFESMEKIMTHSYLSDTSYISGYIDYYYCFNYVDVEKESIRDISNDVGIETGVDQGEATKVSRIKFNNETKMNKSCFYFSQDIRYKNNATRVSLNTGNKSIFKAYDRSSKNIQIFSIDSLTSDGSKSIILKGSKYDTEEFNNNSTTNYMGKMDLDNIHKNYLYAPILNERNLLDMKKLEMKIKLPSHNLNVYKLQKVDVTVINTTTSPTDIKPINWRQSGEWTISDIVFKFDTENTKKVFTQEISLMRKEIPKTPDEIENTEPLENGELNDKVNENPAPVLPNSVYRIGDVYRVKDSKGFEYLISVESVSDDGNFISGFFTSIPTYDPPQPAPTPVTIEGKESPKEEPKGNETSTEETPVVTPTETEPAKEEKKVEPEPSDIVKLTQGNLHVNKDKTAPLVIVFGGNDVNGKKSGQYMYDYFTNDVMGKFNVFIATSSGISGKTAYSEITKKITALGIKPSKKILYLFSGGWNPGMELTTMGKDFNRIFLVDIWIGKGKGANNKLVSDFFKELVDNYAAKVQYYSYGGKDATGGSGNKDTRSYIIKRAKISHLSSKDHMGTNKPAVKYILEKLNELDNSKNSGSSFNKGSGSGGTW